MLLAALVLQAATPQTAVDAERAFAAAAEARGQWTAFREYATADAMMFVPQPVKAQEWLRDKRDPVKSVEWWPVESYVSCSGNLAVNTGGALWPDGSSGYFSTIWAKQGDGSWKWLADHGGAVAVPRARPSRPKVVRASCAGKPMIDMGGCLSDADSMGCHAARDQSLQARWVRKGDAVAFSAVIWTGRGWKTVFDEGAAPAK
ncbi:hypothetical protein ACCC88_02375 [Sphingomonas sp. Sphisp140]|uniref:hypothetical protein n=1 Tax=unclassified Sphingomonas TaxID=196159 RepID=UPI0039AFBC44